MAVVVERCCPTSELQPGCSLASLHLDSLLTTPSPSIPCPALAGLPAETLSITAQLLLMFSKPFLQVPPLHYELWSTLVHVPRLHGGASFSVPLPSSPLSPSYGFAYWLCSWVTSVHFSNPALNVGCFSTDTFQGHLLIPWRRPNPHTCACVHRCRGMCIHGCVCAHTCTSDSAFGEACLGPSSCCSVCLGQ